MLNGITRGNSPNQVPRWLEPGTQDSVMHGEYSGVR